MASLFAAAALLPLTLVAQELSPDGATDPRQPTEVRRDGAWHRQAPTPVQDGARHPLDPTGVWRVTLRETDGVELQFRMTFAATTERWEAWSRLGAAREMVGGGTALLGRMFGKMPPKEALVYIGEGTIRRDGTSTHLTGTVDSPFLGRRRFVGTIADDRWRADLAHLPSGRRAGTMEAVRDGETAPIRDYVALAADVEHAIRTQLYDPSLLARREFVRFFAELKTRFANARDDLDVIGAFHALKPALGVSHFDFIRAPRLSRASIDDILEGDPAVDPSVLVRLTFPAAEVAFLRIARWDRVGPHVDSAFERIAAAGAQVLILDIRDNPGGDASSITPFTHLVNERTIIGAFLARPWFERPAAQRPALADLPVLESNASPAQLIRDLRAHGGVTGVAIPRAPHFSGLVFLLVDEGTSSASEPLAHALKVAKRATVIGQRTAGAMLTALPHGLRDGWVATIPQADFITADGRRLEGAGVEPDVRSDPDEAFLAVASRLPGTLPFSAEMLRGGSYEALKKPDEAERSYRAALRVVDRQTPVPPPAARAAIHRRLANIRKAKGDRAGALREYEEVLKLVPDDAEALAAVRGG